MSEGNGVGCRWEFVVGQGWCSECESWYECVHRGSLPDDFVYCPYCGEVIERVKENKNEQVTF